MGIGSEVMFQHNFNQVTEEDAKQKLRLSEVGCAAFDTTSYWFAIIGGEVARPSGFKGTGFEIWRSLVQIFHHTAIWICFR